MSVRVLHCLGTLNPGGVETWLMHVLRNIDRERFQLDFCTFGNEPGLYAAEAEKLGSKVLRCPKDANLWSFGRRFRRILRDGRYDVVHSHVHLFSGAVLRWANTEGVPMRIAHSHTSRDDQPDTILRGYYSKLMKSWIERHATHGLAASRVGAATLFGENWQAERRFRVLYYGIDLEPFRQPLVRAEVRAELGIPVDALIVGHVGRFVTPKNHSFLLEIASEILKRRPEIYFLLVGDGPLRPEIEAQARIMGFDGKMRFVGTRTDVPRIMRGAMDVFVFPSVWEGLPVALIEAQAAGLTCIVSDAVTREAAILARSVDFLALSAGASHWAAQMVKALDSPQPDSTPAPGKVAQRGFSIQQSVLALTRVYSGFQEFFEKVAIENDKGQQVGH